MKGDRRGLDKAKKINLNKKNVISKAKELTNDEKIGKILELASQSRWTDWDELINLDLKWKELLYSFSPSMLSFLLNSIQGTLPDPMNLRRWKKTTEAKCHLYGWKFCSQVHILCGCKVALQQGRISWRHDSLLGSMMKWIKASMMKNKDNAKNNGGTNTLPQLKDSFVAAGNPSSRKKKRSQTQPQWWCDTQDWKFLSDKRNEQYQIPPEIACSSLRPDICIYSLDRKKCLFVELTSPFEDNIAEWKVKKSTKYEDLVRRTKENGWNTKLFTVEVGARGFVNTSSMSLFRFVGLTAKQCKAVRKELSIIAIRSSYFIWLNRENKEWVQPARVVS